jgi:uncharacterized phage-associated protein
MVSVRDVAEFIEQEGHGSGLTRMKLLKLAYYAQVWSLVWDRAPLFADAIEAWDDGPVVRNLWIERKHATIPPKGNPDALSPAQKATVREVLRFYGHHDGDWLSALTHRETPWLKARAGTPRGAQCSTVISHKALLEYYGNIGEIKPKQLTKEYDRGLHLLVNLAPEEINAIFDDTADDEDGAQFTSWLTSPSA